MPRLSPYPVAAPVPYPASTLAPPPRPPRPACPVVVPAPPRLSRRRARPEAPARPAYPAVAPYSPRLHARLRARRAHPEHRRPLAAGHRADWPPRHALLCRP
ncbi:hypothetical protein GUJ93_ZPchr0010g8754 [Zizania palustris]|uniref:Uncharacterized protein n=1 Tax=Zizania palustris TaxID=103762 RepID=A0A8J5W7J1_ZIZPA|nr:hypothetical protein GUJ93_ZPchr0010g8754 [Zizania palustris]